MYTQFFMPILSIYERRFLTSGLSMVGIVQLHSLSVYKNTSFIACIIHIKMFSTSDTSWSVEIK